MRGRLRGPSMLALVGDMTGPTLWRCLQPITALEQAGYRCGWDRTAARLAPRLSAEHEGTLFFRVSWPTGARRLVARAFEQVRAAGRFIVCDYDDELFSLGFVYRQLELGWTDGKPYEQLEAERLERIWALQQADGVTVSTEPLAAVVRSYTDRPVIVVPNAIDVPWFRSAVRRRKRQLAAVTIGWAGGARPDEDLAPMAEAWRRIAARYPGVRFVVQGHQPEVFRRAVPADRLHALPWLPLERYPEGLAEVDIACCSVAADRFNACKSVIKAYEAAIAGSAVVASRLLYGELVEHGVTGRLAETADEWECAFATYLTSDATRKMEARRLERYVERRCSLAENLWRWPAAWSAIAADARARRAVTV